MLALAQFFAIAATTGFAGAAIYINLVEHPARMGCSTELAATVWAPSDKLASFTQTPIVVIGSLGGVAAWLQGAGVIWLVGALWIFAVIPFTRIVMFPIRNRLLAPDRDPASAETRELLVKWGQLHVIRSVLGFVAGAIYIWQVLGR